MNALGYVTETLAYDGAGRPLSVRDANNVITDFRYDARGPPDPAQGARRLEAESAVPASPTGPPDW